jgi:hypothetical protein
MFNSLLLLVLVVVVDSIAQKMPLVHDHHTFRSAFYARRTWTQPNYKVEKL